MYSSPLAPKLIVLVPILAIELLLIRSVLSLNMTNSYLHHTCFENQGKYNPGSQYEKYQNAIVHNIASTTVNFLGGYDMMSFGQGPDYVSVILQCRGDSYGPKCRSCFTTALSGLRRRCPRNKGGIIWYDQCLLEFSGINAVGEIDYNNNVCMSNPRYVTVAEDQFLFDKTWNTLIDNLTTIATSIKNYSDPNSFYAVGERKFNTEKMYGMVQCTKDLSFKSCEACVLHNLLHFQKCLTDKRGARVLGRSCSFRFELYPFVTTKARVLDT